MAPRTATIDRAHPRYRRLERLQENIGADSVKLTAEELQKLEAINATGNVQGARGTGGRPTGDRHQLPTPYVTTETPSRLIESQRLSAKVLADVDAVDHVKRLE